MIPIRFFALALVTALPISALSADVTDPKQHELELLQADRADAYNRFYDAVRSGPKSSAEVSKLREEIIGPAQKKIGDHLEAEQKKQDKAFFGKAYLPGGRVVELNSPEAKKALELSDRLPPKNGPADSSRKQVNSQQQPRNSAPFAKNTPTAPRSPQRPEVVLDGKGIPKEVHFGSGKTPSQPQNSQVKYEETPIIAIDGKNVPREISFPVKK